MLTHSDWLPKAVTREVNQADRADAHCPGNYGQEKPLQWLSGFL